MTILGVDVSSSQPTRLPWAAWAADGLQVAVIQITHGAAPEPRAAEHLAAAYAAGLRNIGAYHYLLPGNGARQHLYFDLQLQTMAPYVRDPRITFCALDVEEPGITAQDVLDFCQAYTDPQRPLLLYGNYSLLVGILDQQPALKRYPIWWSEYGPMRPNATEPPYAAPNPPAGLHLAGWQWGGDNAIWPPYGGAIDRSVWYEVPGAQPASLPERAAAIAATAAAMLQELG